MSAEIFNRIWETIDRMQEKIGELETQIKLIQQAIQDIFMKIKKMEEKYFEDY